MTLNSRHWRQTGVSPLHFVLRCLQDSQARGTRRLYRGATPDLCRGIATFARLFMSFRPALGSAFGVVTPAALSGTEAASASGGALLPPGTREGICFWAARPPPGGFCGGSPIVMFAEGGFGGRRFRFCRGLGFDGRSRSRRGLADAAPRDGGGSVRFGVRGLDRAQPSRVLRE